MRKVFAAILIVLFGSLFLIGISNNVSLVEYNGLPMEERVSAKYINKNVTVDNPKVEYGVSKDLEDGSANIVTSIVVNYRSFDTLGEVTILFLSAIGVAILLGASGKYMRNGKSGFILKKAAGYLFPVILIVGIYMFIHGHLTPGGGFPGGSIIASSFLLMYLADDNFRLKMQTFKITEGAAGSLYVILGGVGIFIGGYFLQNFIPTGTVGGLFSGGIIPIVYILIGLKVGSEVAGLLSDFFKEEVAAND